MSCITGVSEADFLTAVERVVAVLSSQFKPFGSFDKADIAQFVRWQAVEAMPCYKAEIGALEPFLFRHCRNRLLNASRSVFGRLSEFPCAICNDFHLGRGPGHLNGETCKSYEAWLKRNQTKANLARPLDITNLSYEQESSTLADSTVVEDVAIDEILRLIDEGLDADHRRLLLQLREGVRVPKKARREVEGAVMEVLREVGLTADDLGLLAEVEDDEQEEDTAGSDQVTGPL